MRLKTLSFVIALLAVGSHFASSQSTPAVQLPQVIPSSPEAMSLIRSIQYPVSYGHGSANISIPLYEIVVGDVVIPISVSYNHKGLRPLEFTHYLGQGWSLSAEPSISRKTNGRADNDCEYVLPGDMIPYTSNDWGYRNAVNIGNIDAYPDEYYYSIPGKSGAFVFKRPSPGSGVATVPFEPVRVEYFRKGSQYPDGAFAITDDDGTIYSFRLAEYTDTGSSPSGWKCSSITTQKGSVTFSYDNSRKETVRSISEYLMIDDEYVRDPLLVTRPEQYEDLPKVYQWSSYYGKRTVYTLQSNQSSPYENKYYFERKKDYDGLLGGIDTHGSYVSRINEIKFPEGRVVFLRNDKGTLTSITVYNNSNEPIRTIIFNHDTIPGYANESPYPILKTVEITGGGADERYSFEYHQGSANFPFSNAQSAITPPVNFWGYWTAGGETLASQFGRIYYVHRDWYSANFDKGDGRMFTEPYYFPMGDGNRLDKVEKNGILKSITTKSGSVTEFDYESDKFNMRKIFDSAGNTMPVDVLSGGLRIKKIIQHDGNPAKAVERHFEYGPLKWETEYGTQIRKQVGTGLGRTREEMSPELYHSIQAFKDYGVDQGFEWRRQIVSANMNGDMTTSGVPIVYDYVTEYTKGYVNGVLQNFGRTVYRYGYSSTGTRPRHYNTGLTYNTLQYDWTQGNLESREVYRYDGIENRQEKWTRLQSTNYLYSGFSQNHIQALQVWPTLNCINTSDPYGPTNPDIIGDYGHVMEPGCTRLYLQTDSLFTDSGVVVSQTRYTYNTSENHKTNLAHLYPLSVTTTRSDGTEQTRSFRYVQDSSGISDSEHSAAVAVMRTKNILSPVVEQTESSGTSVRTVYNLYTAHGSKSPSGLPVVQKTAVKDGSLPSEDRIVYHKYDQAGNPVYATKDGITNIVYLWGYNRSKLVAVIENATEQQVADALNAGGVGVYYLYHLAIEAGNFDQVVNALRSGNRSDGILKDAAITTFKHRPMVGIEEITDPRDITTFYIYDAKGRLILVNDHEGNPVKAYHYHIKN